MRWYGSVGGDDEMPVCKFAVIMPESAPYGFTESAIEEFGKSEEFVELEEAFFAVGKDFGCLRADQIVKIGI